VAYTLAATNESESSSGVEDTTLSFDRVLIVVLENQPLSASLKNAHMRNVMSKGTLLINYYALVNPSQPNYIGLLAGDVMGVTNDDMYNIDAQNLVDLLEAKNISWKSYQEDYPGDCYADDTIPSRLYKRKHNPFISFDNIRNDPERCAKIVNSDELAVDIEKGTVPQYSFYTPNMDNNGHDTGLGYTAEWLADTFLPKYLEPFNNTGNALLVITFDEGVPGNNKIYTLLIGDMIPSASIDNTRYTHYSLLRLVEENYGLGSLNRNDKSAPQITKANFIKGVPAIENIGLVFGAVAAMSLVGVAGIIGGVLYVRRQQLRKTRDLENNTHELLLESFTGDDEEEENGEKNV